MLRIATLTAPRGTILALSGRLVGDWIAELARTFELLGGQERVTLDLSDVSFVSNDGLALLRSLIGRGARMEGCPPYIALQLNDGVER